MVVALDRNYIGSYRLLKMVRAGATCQIWEAISEIDNRRCALKTLQEEFRTNKDEIALLKHEYTVGHELQHPCVIEIYDYDVAKGVPYLALEYFESNNLKQWLRIVSDDRKLRKTLPGIIRQAAEGLQYLHQQGWIHRDIKPDNFLVNDAGEVKLIDFAIAERIKKGFARFLPASQRSRGREATCLRSRFAANTLMPAQISTALAAWCLKCCAGGHRSPAAARMNCCRNTSSHPYRRFWPATHVAPDFAALITRMMKKNRDERPGSMQEFLDTLTTTRIFRVQRA